MPTLVTPEGRAHRIENKAQLLHGMVENAASQELIQQGTAVAGAGALELPTLRCRSLMHILLLLQFLCMP